MNAADVQPARGETLGQPLNLLLVEDDEVDVLALRRALLRCPVPLRLHVVNDGTSALDHLRQRPPGAQRWLVMLDLNLPRMGGLEFLARLRSDAGLAALPVVVMTTSKDARDIARAYAYQVAGYFRKPLDPAQAAAAMAALTTYWSTSELP